MAGGHEESRRRQGYRLPFFPFWLLAGISVLFVLPSFRLWFQRPLRLTVFEFDYFLGLFMPANLDLRLAIIQFGRLIHCFGFLLIGWLFVLCVERVRKDPDQFSWRSLILFAVILCITFTIAMPWVSPDIFYYIGTGWLDGHYGLSPYLHTMTEVPQFGEEEMFQNVHPPFLAGSTAYGPLFQLLDKGLSVASGGRELFALGLHKILYFFAHAASCFVLLRLVPASESKWSFLFFACNPLILFSILTCVHNDHIMTFFLLTAFWCLAAGRPFLAGVALGTAFSVKYIPLLLLPLFFLDLALDRGRKRSFGRRLGLAFGMTVGFLCTVVAFHCLYPEAARQFLRLIGFDPWLSESGSIASGGGGIGVYRNSIYHLIPFLYSIFPGFWPIGYDQMKIVLVAIFSLTIAWLVVRSWRRGKFPLMEASLSFFLFYFLVLNQTNQEWYLTWILAFIPMIGTEPVLRFGYRISVLFLPLVIFTVKNMALVESLTNALVYVLVLLFSVPVLVQFYRSIRSESELLQFGGDYTVRG